MRSYWNRRPIWNDGENEDAVYALLDVAYREKRPGMRMGVWLQGRLRDFYKSDTARLRRTDWSLWCALRVPVRIQLARLSRWRVTLVAKELPRGVRLEPVEQEVERLRAARRRGGFRLPTLGVGQCVGLVEGDRAASTWNVERENDAG